MALSLRVMVALVLTLTLLAARAGAHAPDERPGKTVGQRVDELIADADSVASAAKQWLRSQRQRAEQEVDDLLARAREQAPKPFVGLRVLGPDDAPPAADSKHPWQTLPRDSRLPARVVLLVHGINEPGSIWDDLTPELLKAGRSLVRFDYASDGAIPESADALAKALKDLRARGVEQTDIVGYSMGGLVVRDVLTRPAYYAGDARGGEALPSVPRFIMIGTPNAGSVAAHLWWLSALREDLVRWVDSDGENLTALLGAVITSSGQGADDLLPDSAFLKDLNSRPRPTNVRITAVVGTVADGTAKTLKGLLDGRLARRLLETEDLEWLKKGLEEASTAAGDGVVTVDSAAWKDANEVVKVPSDHRQMIRRFDLEHRVRAELGLESAVAAAIPEIVSRLADAAPGK